MRLRALFAIADGTNQTRASKQGRASQFKQFVRARIERRVSWLCPRARPSGRFNVRRTLPATIGWRPSTTEAALVGDGAASRVVSRSGEVSRLTQSNELFQNPSVSAA